MGANKLLSPNTSLCYNSLLYTYYHELPVNEIYYYYGSFEDIVFNTTRTVSNVSSTLDMCLTVVDDTMNYMNREIAEFDTFSAYTLAMFQHLVANIITISMIY
jgi:hypothetical protein